MAEISREHENLVENTLADKIRQESDVQKNKFLREMLINKSAQTVLPPKYSGWKSEYPVYLRKEPGTKNDINSIRPGAKLTILDVAKETYDTKKGNNKNESHVWYKVRVENASDLNTKAYGKDNTGWVSAEFLHADTSDVDNITPPPPPETVPPTPGPTPTPEPVTPTPTPTPVPEQTPTPTPIPTPEPVTPTPTPTPNPAPTPGSTPETGIPPVVLSGPKERSEGSSLLENGAKTEEEKMGDVIDGLTREEKIQLLRSSVESKKLTETQKARIGQIEVFVALLQGLKNRIDGRGDAWDAKFTLWQGEKINPTEIDNIRRHIDAFDPQEAMLFIEKNPEKTLNDYILSTTGETETLKRATFHSDVPFSGPVHLAFGMDLDGYSLADVKNESDLLKYRQSILSFLRSEDSGGHYEIARSVAADGLQKEFSDIEKKINTNELKEKAKKQTQKIFTPELYNKNYQELSSKNPTMSGAEVKKALDDYQNALTDESFSQLKREKIGEYIYDNDTYEQFSPEKRQIWDEFRDSMGYGAMDVSDENWDTIMSELAINAPLILVSGGVANVAVKGLSMGARAVAGRVLPKVIIASGRAAAVTFPRLNTAVNVSKFAAGLGIEGTVFEMTHTALTKGDLNIFNNEGWGTKVFWTSLALGAFKGVGKLQQSAMMKGFGEKIGGYAGKIPGSAKLTSMVNKFPEGIREKVGKVLYGFTAFEGARNMEASAMFLIGAAQEMAISDDAFYNDLYDYCVENGGDNYFHSLVAAHALNLAHSGVSSLGKKLQSKLKPVKPNGDIIIPGESAPKIPQKVNDTMAHKSDPMYNDYIATRRGLERLEIARKNNPSYKQSAYDAAKSKLASFEKMLKEKYGSVEPSTYSASESQKSTNTTQDSPITKEAKTQKSDVESATLLTTPRQLETILKENFPNQEIALADGTKVKIQDYKKGEFMVVKPGNTQGRIVSIGELAKGKYQDGTEFLSKDQRRELFEKAKSKIQSEQKERKNTTKEAAKENSLNNLQVGDIIYTKSGAVKTIRGIDNDGKLLVETVTIFTGNALDVTFTKQPNGQKIDASDLHNQVKIKDIIYQDGQAMEVISTSTSNGRLTSLRTEYTEILSQGELNPSKIIEVSRGGVPILGEGGQPIKKVTQPSPESSNQTNKRPESEQQKTETPKTTAETPKTFREAVDAENPLLRRILDYLINSKKPVDEISTGSIIRHKMSDIARDLDTPVKDIRSALSPVNKMGSLTQNPRLRRENFLSISETRVDAEELRRYENTKYPAGCLSLSFPAELPGILKQELQMSPQPEKQSNKTPTSKETAQSTPSEKIAPKTFKEAVIQQNPKIVDIVKYLKENKDTLTTTGDTISMRIIEGAHYLKMKPQEVREGLRINLLGKYSTEPLLRNENFISIQEARVNYAEYKAELPKGFTAESYNKFLDDPINHGYAPLNMVMSVKALDALVRELGL